MRSARLLLFAAAFLLAALVPAGCGKPHTDVAEVQFWNFGGTDRFLKWVRERVETFNATHPGIHVALSDKSWHQIREIVYAAYSAGNGPDVMTLHADHAAEFGDAGFFYPLDNFPDFARVKELYDPHLMESTRFKGKYYGLPSCAIAFVLVCNKELFDAAGLRPPRTWSEFREAARRLTRDTNGDGAIEQYGLVLLGGDKGGFVYRLAPLLFRAGVRVLSDDLTTVKFACPRCVATVQLLADMNLVDHSITPGFLAYTLSEINDLFCSNKVAMSIEGPWFSAMVAEKSPGKEFYTVPVPVPDDLIGQYDTAPSLQDMVMYPINARSRHLAAAWEFVKFMRSEESDMAFAREDFSGIATTRHALASPECAQRTGWPVYRNEIQHSQPWPPHPRIIPIVKNVITPYVEKAIVGELTPAAAVDAARREAQAVLEESR